MKFRIMAATMGRPETAHVLVKAGADLNVKDRYGETALTHAAEKGHRELVRLLKGAGGVKNSMRSDACRAMSLAVLVALSCLWSAQRAAAQVVSARSGLVTRAEGEVWLYRSGDYGRLPLKMGEKLSAGDVILAGARGRAELSLQPNSILQIGAGSQVRIYDIGLDQMHFDIERGEVYAIVGAFKQGVALVLDTPSALFRVVKNGRYRVRVTKGYEVEAAVAQGELQFAGDQGKIVRVTKRRRARFAASSKEQMNGKWAHSFTVRQE